MSSHLARIAADIDALEPRVFEGRVSGMNGLMIEASGPVEALVLGARDC